MGPPLPPPISEVLTFFSFFSSSLSHSLSLPPLLPSLLLSLSQVSTLKSKLKKQSTATGSGVARAFLRTQAALFGSYRDALRYRPVSPCTHLHCSLSLHSPPPPSSLSPHPTPPSHFSHSAT